MGVEIPESSLLLAGFVLAHAAWSISDTQDLLCPIAVVEERGSRKLLRFEAATQVEAIANGKAKMAAINGKVDRWAFAREGLIHEGETEVDVISVGIGTRGQ